MDPLAHTLAGATLAETGLRRVSRYATLSLLVGANLPDVDALAMLWGEDTALFVRRGWSHGVVGLIVLPWIWVGALVLYDRFVHRARPREGPPLRFGVLLGLTQLAVLTHPFLDWLNTYGVRLLMPFRAEWFYGDAIFIIDPWMWVLLASAVVLARSRGRLVLSGWAILGIGTTALVLGVERTSMLAKFAWMLGVAAIVMARVAGWGRSSVPRLAIGASSLVGLYIAMMLAGNRIAHEEVTAWLRSEGIDGQIVMVGPVPARPFARDVIARTATHYHFVELDWVRPNRFGISHPPVALGPSEAPAVQAALRSPAVRGLRTWMRLPAFELETTSAGHRVTIRDVRYARPETERTVSLGKAVVDLDPNLDPRRKGR